MWLVNKKTNNRCFRYFDSHDEICAEGFKEAAEKFALEAGFKAPAELERLDERIKIRDAIQAGKIQEATALVNQLHPDLLDSDRYLFFHLQQQHLIELIRQKNIEEALRFAQVEEITYQTLFIM